MGSKILILDIETAPMEVRVWGLGKQYVGHDQIRKDWHLLSFAAKWLGDKKVMYFDQRNAKKVENDKPLLKRLHALLDETDILVTQNGIEFDAKKINARLAKHGFQPPSPYKHIDLYRIKTKHFGFSSNKLAYTSEFLNEKYKKLEHEKFPGRKLWDECLAGNLEAWKEMERYNKHDVLSEEEEYLRLRSWDTSISVTLGGAGCRSCGSHNLQRRGYEYTAAGKQQRFVCNNCGAWSKSGTNLLSAAERKEIQRKI